MEIIKSNSETYKPKIVMLVYGHGGVGKTTFAATSPNPVLADFEGGAKYFGLRGIQMDVARINSWKDIQDFYRAVKESKYETVVLDPIGEAMEKLEQHMIELNNRKLTQADGQPTMAGWGWLKDNMRKFIKSVRDLDKHLLIIAHVEEKESDEGGIKKRPMLKTKLSQELINMVDIVAYMETAKSKDGEIKRVLRVQPESDKYEAKDRTGQLGEIIEPNFANIVDGIQGNKNFSWIKQLDAKREKHDQEFQDSLPEMPEAKTVEPEEIEDATIEEVEAALAEATPVKE